MVETNKYVQKFRELYREKNGRDITDDEALAYFTYLVTLVDAVYKPIKKEK